MRARGLLGVTRCAAFVAGVAAFAAVAAVAAVAGVAGVAGVGGCSSAPRFPACERDEQCVSGATHDYCVAGTCVYCRTSVDCADRQMCRAGACVLDPNAPPSPAADAGEDADDGSAEAADDDAAPEDDEGDRAPDESPRRLPRGVRRFFHP